MEEMDSRHEESQSDDDPADDRYEDDLLEESDGTAFKVLEEEFQNVLAQLEKKEGMATFVNEFNRLFEAFVKSHGNEKRLRKKCKELEAEVVANSGKMAVALKVTSADKDIIEQLKQEIETSWKMVDTAHAREQIAQETVNNLRQQVRRLNRELERRGKLDLDQGDESVSLTKSKEVLIRERDKILKEMGNLQERLSNALTYQNQLEKRYAAAEAKIVQLTAELQAQQTETAKEQRYKERMSLDLKELQKAKETSALEISNLTAQIGKCQDIMKKMETSLKEQRTYSERVQHEIENVNSRSQKMQADYESQVVTVEKLVAENSEKAAGLRQKEDEIMRLKNETTKSQKVQESLLKKLKQAELHHYQVEEEKEKLQVEIKDLERDINSTKRQNENDRRNIENILREKHILGRSLLKVEDQAKEHVKLLKIQEQVKINLENEIEQYVQEASKQRKIILTLERERDRYIADTAELNHRIQKTAGEIKMKETAIFDYKKKVTTAEFKLRQQQSLFDSIRTERNTFSKHLLEAQDEISELKQKIKVMTHQTEQLKEDISNKETQLMKGEFALEKMEKEKDNLRLEVQQLKDELQKQKCKISVMQQEEQKLNKIIMEADEDHQRQRKDMEQMMNERDILGTQLVRRNDELGLLYKKVKILQSTLEKGEAQYDQRLDDIRLLKLEIKRLRHEKVTLTRSLSNMPDLRQEILHLERDLTREQLKCRALEEELQNPLNVHRWRKLEGSDPTSYEMIQKIQILQKRLIAQSTQAVERENQLREAERLYLHLRQMMARQPGPEVTVQLQKTQQALRDRGRKMKCLVSELNMYEAKVTEYKEDMDRMTQELQDMKKKYYMQKSRERKLKSQTRQGSEGVVLPPLSTTKTRITGGGFNMTQQPAKTSSIWN